MDRWTGRKELCDPKEKYSCQNPANGTGIPYKLFMRMQDLQVAAFDPFANAAAVFAKHQIKLVTNLERYDAIVLTVAHDFFKSLNYEALKKSDNSIIYDTKAFLDKKIVTARL